MSDEQNDMEKITENEVVVTVEDMKNLRNYTEYFGVSAFKGLVQAANKFAQEPNYTNQQEFIRSFCLWITESKHETFTDPLWDKPKEVAKQLLDTLNADKVLQDAINEVDEDPEELQPLKEWTDKV